MRDFPNKALAVPAMKLFCTACWEGLILKLTVIRQHFKSKKHTLGKEHLLCKDKWEKDIAVALAAYNKEEHFVAEKFIRGNTGLLH